MAQALQPDARGDWLRMLRGVLFALGAVVLLARKSDDWAAFPLLIVAGVPCVVVFGLGALATGGRNRGRVGGRDRRVRRGG